MRPVFESSWYSLCGCEIDGTHLHQPMSLVTKNMLCSFLNFDIRNSALLECGYLEHESRRTHGPLKWFNFKKIVKKLNNYRTLCSEHGRVFS